MSAQRMTSLPFSSKPSAQAKVQLLLYADASADGEQSMLPWAGLSGASHAMAEGRMPDKRSFSVESIERGCCFPAQITYIFKTLNSLFARKTGLPMSLFRWLTLQISVLSLFSFRRLTSQPNRGGGIPCVVPQTLRCIIYAGL